MPDMTAPFKRCSTKESAGIYRSRYPSISSLIAFQQFTSALEIQVIALMQLYAVFYAVLSLSITGYIPAPEYPEMYDSAVSCLFSNPSIV